MKSAGSMDKFLKQYFVNYKNQKNFAMRYASYQKHLLYYLEKRHKFWAEVQKWPQCFFCFFWGGHKIILFVKSSPNFTLTFNLKTLNSSIHYSYSYGMAPPKTKKPQYKATINKKYKRFNLTMLLLFLRAQKKPKFKLEDNL